MKLFFSAIMLTIVNLASCWAQTNSHAAIARELAEEGDHLLSAVEYRRMAMDSSNDVAAAGYYWAAAYEYWLAGNHPRQVKNMLDKAEHLSPALFRETMLLKARHAINSDHFAEASFYLESVSESVSEEPETGYAVDLRNLATLRLAEVRFSESKSLNSREILEQLPPQINKQPLASLRSYRKGNDKSPVLGGILGLAPGLGYAYSGEYGNALRSLILNGLFIYAMSDTAANEQWGAFTALSFFELTWYTGSIYGGIDAAHRYNRSRFQECLNDINSEGSFSLDRSLIPVIKLNVEFGKSE